MKNITAIALFVFSLLGVKANAQTFEVEWYDRINSENITTVVSHSGFTYPVIMRPYKNGAPYTSPIWEAVYEDTLFGPGQDTIRFDNLSVNNGNGYGGLVKMFDLNYSQVGIYQLFQSVHPLADLQIQIYDWVDMTMGDITFYLNIDEPYGIGRPFYYDWTLQCRLRRTSSPGYQPLSEAFIEPTEGVVSMTFVLPWQVNGDYCFECWATDDDTSINDHFDNELLWGDTMCFSIGTTGLQGLTARETSTEVVVYPNPTTDVVNVTLQKAANSTLVDMAGRQVLVTGRLSIGVNQLDLRDLAPGFYILQMDDGHWVRIEKR